MTLLLLIEKIASMMGHIFPISELSPSNYVEKNQGNPYKNTTLLLLTSI